MSPEMIEKIQYGLEILGGIVVVATVIARLTPSPKDDGIVKKISDVVFKVIAYLPTIGINPNTKKLEKMVNEHNNEDKK